MNRQISLLDYFAGLAMQAIVQDSYSDGVYIGEDNDSEHMHAEQAYLQAYAMLQTREIMVKRLMLEQADESTVN